MKISREEVLRVAELAHLELSESEVAKYREQIDSILDYIAKLNAVDTSNVEPMTQVLADTAGGANVTGDAKTAGGPETTLWGGGVGSCGILRAGFGRGA